MKRISLFIMLIVLVSFTVVSTVAAYPNPFSPENEKELFNSNIADSHSPPTINNDMLKKATNNEVVNCLNTMDITKIETKCNTNLKQNDEMNIDPSLKMNTMTGNQGNTVYIVLINTNKMVNYNNSKVIKNNKTGAKLLPDKGNLEVAYPNYIVLTDCLNEDNATLYEMVMVNSSYMDNFDLNNISEKNLIVNNYWSNHIGKSFQINDNSMDNSANSAQIYEIRLTHIGKSVINNNNTIVQNFNG